MTKLPEIKSLRPTGTRILVEMLTPQETLGTKKVFVDDAAEVPVHQAYILAMGPNVPENFGTKVGDRVWLEGGIVYGPKYDDNPRKRGTVEYHMVKGVIIEN